MYLMSNRYKRIHTLSTKISKMDYRSYRTIYSPQRTPCSAVAEDENTLSRSSVQSETDRRAEVTVTKFSKSYQMQLLLWCACVKGEKEDKSDRVRQYGFGGTRVFLLFINVGIPPQTLSTTI